MEKKTTRRIIGILVVVALVIILLPLMFNENETTAAPLQTSEANPPPFPGNSDPATLAENTVPPSHIGEMINHIVANDEQPAAEETVVTEETQPTSRVRTKAPAVEVRAARADATPPATEQTGAARQTLVAEDSTLDGVNLQNADLMTANSQTVSAQVLNDANNKIAEITNTQAPEPIKEPVQAPEAAAVVTNAVVTKAPAGAAVITKTTTTARNNVVTTTTTVTAKKLGWLVQLGSFKSKVNAERLTNSLRAKGYKAFTIQTKSNGQTRVCVGPEFKQVAANTIASKIAQEMKMQGIVMPYQAIAL
jgi:cell division septation protein DedD